MSSGEPTTDESSADNATWGWAVVEIRRDGTCGVPDIVPATVPVDSTASDALAAAASGRLQEFAPLLQAPLGSLHVSNGNLLKAAAAFRRGTRSSTSSPGRIDCLGRLAHVMALQGELRRASRLAGRVHESASVTAGAGFDHAQMARSWIALERADFAEARRRLQVVARSIVVDQDPWLAASALLVDARVLLATGEPEASRRLLAGACEEGSPLGGPGWLSDLLTIARAEALLASGEPQRSLAALTPMPEYAGTAAAVVVASARRWIGDVRGAQAVLGRVAADLDREPLALQVQAWLLEARLAEDRGKHDRARSMVDRALRSAAAEQMRRPLMAEWQWLRRHVDRDPALQRSHREFLSTCHVDEAASRGRARHGAAEELAAPLTEREGQVLDLLAEMCSTEEIAAALYVSSNTVKTHVRGIFGKLCVNRRVDAVRRGRQIGLC
jgi:LuxR family maltose regulon positive regulatory protein